MYAKNVAFPGGFLCNSLLKEKQKNSIVPSIMALQTKKDANFLSHISLDKGSCMIYVAT